MKFLLSGFPFFLAASVLSAQEKITYADHVRPLLENKCFSCHNPDKKKGDLDLTSFSGTMAGGGGGAVVNAGDAEGSKLVSTTTKKAEPFMPPEGAPLSAKDVDILSRWITGGVLETASSVAKKAAPKANLTLASAPKGKPDGPPPVPEHVLLEPTVTAPRNTAVTALAASPWAPLVAVSGLKQALVYDTQTQMLAGIYPYPEGYIRSLKFSQNGALLIAGGGRGGKMGNAVAWDVKTGKRVIEVGKEFDQVMAADISPNHSMVAMGGPSKKLKCFNASTGEELYVMKKHTEWIMAVAFSPDGVLLASADRNGGVFVSEAENGGEFYIMDSHKVACNGLAWRADSNVLASCGEDGKVITYEMENGKVVKSWDAHGGGCLSVSFTPDGNVVSSGRDGMIRVWDINGTKISESPAQGDLVTEVAALHDSKTIVSGDWGGKVKVWNIKPFAEAGNLSSNPSPLAQRIVESERRAAETVALVPGLEAVAAKADQESKAKNAQVVEAKKQAVEAEASKNRLEGVLKELPGKLAVLDAALKDAQAKRQAQEAEIKKFEQASAEILSIEAVLASLNTEKASLTAPEQATQLAEVDKKIADQAARLEPLKKAIAAAPQPPAIFDKAIRDAQDGIATLNTSKPALADELEAVRKTLDLSLKAMAELEAQNAAAKAMLTAAQEKLIEGRNAAAFNQKMTTLLRAAQFNVGVLSEKEKLEKLEADVKGLQEARNDAEAARTSAVKRITDTEANMAEALAALPALEAGYAKLSTEQPGVGAMLDPGKAEEAQLVAQASTHKNAIGAREAEIKALEQEKATRTAAAQKAAEEINKQLAALGKQREEVAKKYDGPAKSVEAKKAAMAAAQAELEAAMSLKAETDKKAAEASALLAAADKALKDKAGDESGLKAAFDAAVEVDADTKNVSGGAKAGAENKQNAYNACKDDFEKADKVAAPLRDQLKNLDTQMTAQKEALAAKQAEPGNAEKDFGAKSQPARDAIALAKAALDPLEKRLSEVRAKLAVDLKAVEAKRAEVANAKSAVEQTKQRQPNGAKAIDGAKKEIAEKENSLAEIKAELVKIEPGLQPLRDKVKQLTDQYFAMLPK